MPPSDKRNLPLRPGYVAALAILFFGYCLAGYLAWTLFAAGGVGLTDFVAPGEIVVTFDEPGERMIFHEYQGMMASISFSHPPELEGMEIEVAPVGGGPPLALKPFEGFSYSLGPRSGVSIFSFEVPEPGEYRVAADWAPDAPSTEARLIAVGGMGVLSLVGRIFATMGTVLITTFLAGLSALLTLILSREATPATATGARPKDLDLRPPKR